MRRPRRLDEVQPMLAAIAKTAASLCEANDALIQLLEDDQVRLVARHGRLKTLSRVGEVRPLARDRFGHLAILERRTIHVRDLTKTARAGFVESGAAVAPLGVKTILATPLLRDGVAIGSITIRRTKVRPFTPKQIALLKTFADQAAIAIENARLSQALEARNSDLNEALEQQTATSEILRVISSSPTDIHPVLDALVKSATRFCGAYDAVIFFPEGDKMRVAAHHGPIPQPPGLLLPLVPGTVTGRSLLERRAIHVPDLQAEVQEFPEGSEFAKRLGHRTILSVPLLRDDAAIGVIQLRRAEANPFSDKQVALLQTFADQALIAIENVRLFKELEARNQDLTVALEQQTATSELLKVIGRSTFDLEPVFETLAENAIRLCEAERALIFRFDGQLLRVVATHNVPPDLKAFIEGNPQRPGRGSTTARAALERRTIHIHDIHTDPDYTYGASQIDPTTRTMLAIPLLRVDELLGVITIYRQEVRPFTDSQAALMETFADQASIAIENARLLSELQAKNADLTEALEQQTATSEILRVISSSPTNVQPVFEAIADAAMRLCGAASSLVTTFDGELLHLVAQAAISPVAANMVRGVYPRRPGRGFATGRAIVTCAVVQIPDLTADAEFELRDVARQVDFRSILAVPMLRDGVPIGTINVHKPEPGAFTDKQTALLQTFADQAVIAIENVRLFTELGTRNSELRAALEQQTATGEILRVISGSPTDEQPVFKAIVESAQRLCEATYSTVQLTDSGEIRVAAVRGMDEAGVAAMQQAYPRPIARDTTTGRAVLDRRLVHIADSALDPEYTHPLRDTIGLRSILSVPIFREGHPIGAISVWRPEPRPFTDTQIALLQTFADQAVIALENVRLFKELEARNRDLTVALEQQTATSEILQVISSSPTDLQPIFDAIASSATRLCDAAFSVVFRFDGELITVAAAAGRVPATLDIIRSAYPSPPGRQSMSALAILERRVICMADAQASEEYPHLAERARAIGYRSILVVPMLRGDAAIGAVNVARLDATPFTETQIALLQTFADQAVIAIENVRLFKELEARNSDLIVSLDQQTATSEILGVISSSPTDVQPVFETIAANALRLCDATFSAVFRFDGELIHLAALHNVSNPEGAEALRRAFPMPPGRAGTVARAILTGATAYVPDVREDLEYRILDVARAAHYTSSLSVPMLRGGNPIGVINVSSTRASAFSETQIELVKTFADQAVIAVENVRLFKELQARTGELTQSVEKLTALGEVSHALSSTLDVETVLQTIVSRASELAGGAGCAIYEYDEAAEQFELRTTHNFDPGYAEALRAAPLRKGEGLMGRAAQVGEAIQVPDISQPGAYESSVRDTLMRFGYRALLSVPLLREEQIIGSLSLTRKEPGQYSPEVIEVLKTFATQSALAIQNARLFREIADKSRQLEVASRHKSEFLANMSHELRTPLNAIIGFSEVLNERMFGDLNEKQEEYLKDIHASGQHLLSLINDILDLSKIEAGRMELELTDFDLPMAIDNALTLVRERASRRGVTLTLTVGERVGAIRADERKIKQVLLNLLSNAIKFTPEGGRIEVGAAVLDGAVEVSVWDTGVGIAPEDLDAVFEEFKQVGASAAKQEGTGLGLALSRKFIELHGGTIRVTSEVGAGSTFTFCLPART